MIRPAYIYDPDNWEFTYPYDDRNDLIQNLDISYTDIKQLNTLVRGPDRYVINAVLSWDKDNDPDETEIQCFDTEEDAKAALLASLDSRPKEKP